MSAKKVFWDNPYLTELKTHVTGVNDHQITVAETIFYAFSGGQESDQGTIAGYPVIEARKQDREIVYTLPNNHCLKTGDTVLITIDWDRRYRLMRLHFAAELMLEIVTQRFHLEKVGAHIAPHKARIDFKSDSNIKPLLENILTEYNDIIVADKPIITSFSDLVTQRRFWKIDGFAEVPCGGTHVRSTREVGFVVLKRERPGKGIERIEITLAMYP